ncbi:MAG: hypothetical protein DHS20C08_04540 [Rhodomicrobium sp.]|nr:MAG: hypothetical protein DHS20C08_04540 [Rhodomicrobium sp.]
MTTYTINENGLRTIESRINDLGLDWSVDGTAQVIWMKGDFDDDLNNNGYYDFEATKSVNGRIETITITLDDVDAVK